MSQTSTRSQTNFIEAINSLSLSSSPLRPYTSRNSFPEFYSASFPVFSILPSVSESDLTSTIDLINQQACSELSFSLEELKEMGLAAALPSPWVLHGKEPKEAVRWYLETFEKSPTAAVANKERSKEEDPKFYPLGFICIDNLHWQEKRVGLVLVYLDVYASGEEKDKDGEGELEVKAFRLDPKKIGAAIISLRQGDDEISNIRRHCGLQS